MQTVDTVPDAIWYFSKNSHQFMKDVHWPDGNERCLRCGAAQVRDLKKQGLWKCYRQHRSPTFTLRTGTVFEDSRVPLDKWLTATWLIIICKNRFSSYEIGRRIGVTQKTASSMQHRIRLAMQANGLPVTELGGEFENGETMPQSSPLTKEQFESRPEFERFKTIVRDGLTISKSELDYMVRQAKRNSPRLGNPNAPGRKARVHGRMSSILYLPFYG
jgi:hypothetical protein